jgi:hypothetical protein
MPAHTGRGCLPLVQQRRSCGSGVGGQGIPFADRIQCCQQGAGRKQDESDSVMPARDCALPYVH